MSEIFHYALEYSGLACAIFLAYEIWQNRRLEKRIKELEDELNAR
ncbi:hypothetical protein [Campylobacter mucosalis]|nr:hypothetical protein [Campylobacter mucosalis]